MRVLSAGDGAHGGAKAPTTMAMIVMFAVANALNERARAPVASPPVQLSQSANLA